jgi:hypothetical protein
VRVGARSARCLGARIAYGPCLLGGPTPRGEQHAHPGLRTNIWRPVRCRRETTCHNVCCGSVLECKGQHVAGLTSRLLKTSLIFRQSSTALLLAKREIVDLTLDLLVTFLFGPMIGWFVYYINRYRTSALSFSDITTRASVGGVGALAKFGFSAGASASTFGAYSIGLAAGFFSYLLMFFILVSRSENFDTDWFFDGRRKDPVQPYSIPTGTAVTVRPAVAPLASLPRSHHPPLAARRLREVDDHELVHLIILLKPRVPI